uniref:Ubiquitin-like protease family profile domain-containing protein n=1 Tax=Cucumis melo TaxID=3656 RepID=A0A9I9E4U3_CUCME
MKVGIHTLDLTVKAHGLPLDFHRTKPVGDTNPTVMKQTYFMFTTIVDMVDSQDVATPKEKGESSTQKRKRGPTEMKEITRARSESKKLVIQYNELDQEIGQNATKLKSFIGTTVRFHVLITYSDWPTVPKETKDKIFELIEVGFVVDPRSKKTIIQNAGVCFCQFKYRLTTTYVLPFLDDVEKLEFSPNEYSFIDQQHWTEFVASRLKEDFKKKSENGKEKRKKHKYNHRTSRKGYANLMEELDELVATQNTTNTFGDEDILTRALGGKDRPGILRGVGKYVTKKKYFHTATQQKTNEKADEKVTSKEHDRMAKKIKEFEEELLKMKEKDDCVGDLKEEPGMSSNEKSSMEGAENVNDLEDLSNELESEKDVEDVVELNEDIKVNIVKDDEEVEGVTLDKMKVGTPCKLAFETKDHVVAWETIIDSDVEGDNVKVAVYVVVDGDCAIPIPSEQGIYKISQEVGSHILWPRDLVITNNIKMDYGEFTKDISTFAPTPVQNAPVALRFLLRMVEHIGSTIQITTPYDVFGVRRKCCIMIESLKDFTSMQPIATACLDAYIMYLYTRMESSRTLNLYKFVDAGSISCGSSKEERAQMLTARLLGIGYDQLLLIPYNSGNHWTLVVINLTKGAAFWIDPLKNRMDPNVIEVVERLFNLMNKKKPNWRVVKCPKQSGVVECGYYVMRFMGDIIMSTSTSIIQIMKDSPRAYTQYGIDCIRSEWTEFVGKHCVVHHEVLLKCLVDKKVLLKCVVDVQVLRQSIGAMKPYLCQFINGDKQNKIR